MTPSARIEEVFKRAGRAPVAFAPAVATDADGTLWDTDVGDALFCRIAELNDFRGTGAAALRDRGLPHLGPMWDGRSDRDVALELFSRYTAGVIDVRTMCDLQAASVGDRSATELAALIDAVCSELLPRVRLEIRDLLRLAKQRGMTIHVVSASLGILVERMAIRAEIPFDTVSGATLEREGDYVSARIAETSPLFEGKVTAMEATGHWPATIGLGDGGWDHTFLKRVFVPVLVHPKPALVEAMRGIDVVTFA